MFICLYITIGKVFVNTVEKRYLGTLLFNLAFFLLLKYLYIILGGVTRPQIVQRQSSNLKGFNFGIFIISERKSNS